jgi:hypothetical protein
VASATFAKDHELSADLVALAPPGEKCVTPPYRAAGRWNRSEGQHLSGLAVGLAHLPAHKHFFYSLVLAGEPLPKNGNRNKKAAVVTLA